MLSLTYVSRSLVGPDERRSALHDIQAVSIARNSQSGITGLLVAAPEHFAQLLEGSEPAVTEVMTSIEKDPRHRDVIVLLQKNVAFRKCPLWHMACFDSEAYADRNVSSILSAAHGGGNSASHLHLHRLINVIAQDLRKVAC